MSHLQATQDGVFCRQTSFPGGASSEPRLGTGREQWVKRVWEGDREGVFADEQKGEDS